MRHGKAGRDCHGLALVPVPSQEHIYGEDRHLSHSRGGEPEVIECPNCGTMNPEGAEACSKCGQGLLPGPQVISHETPKLPFIKRIPLRKGPVRRG